MRKSRLAAVSICFMTAGLFWGFLHLHADESAAMQPSGVPLSAHVTPQEASQLLKRFSQAQDAELTALKRNQSREMKGLKAAHASQLKQWELKERDARHKFFAIHKRGHERRAYIQDYMDRRDTFIKMQTDEETQRAQAFDVHLSAMKQDQEQHLTEFKTDLDHGDRPPTILWPSGN